MGGDDKSRRIVTGPDPVRRDRLAREMDSKGHRIREHWAEQWIEPVGTPKSTPPQSEYSYRSSRASSTYGGNATGNGHNAWGGWQDKPSGAHPASNHTPSLPPSSQGRPGEGSQRSSAPGSGRSDGLREAQLRMAQAALTATGGPSATVRSPPPSSHGRGSAKDSHLNPDSPTASAVSGSRVTAPSFLGSSFSRFTGFYSPLMNMPMGKLTNAENFRDSQLEKQIVQESQEETSHRKKKDWMKVYQDESVKFAAVTRAGGPKGNKPAN